MRRNRIQTAVLDPEGPQLYTDAFKCQHCQKVTELPPFTEPGLENRCTCCDGLICHKCKGDMWDGKPCIPLEKRLLELEQRDEALRSYGLV